MIWYSHINEDSRIERELLFSGNYKSVACISGSGERLIALLDYPARDFYAIDINPDALKLLELKLKALEHLGVREYLEFIGHMASSSIEKLKMFRDISDSLSSECLEYWKSKSKSISKGIINAGHFECYLSGLRPLVKLFLGSRFDNVFQAGLPQQGEFPFLRWKILNSLFSQRWVLAITGNRDQSFISEMADNNKIGRGLNSILERGEANDAYVFHLIFKGSLASMPNSSLPTSLQPAVLSTIRERIKSGHVKIHYAEGDYNDAVKEFGLCSQGNVFHSLSDIIGFENEVYMKNLLSEILAQPGNMAVARSFLVNHIRSEMLEEAGITTNHWKDYSSMESTHMYQVIAIIS